MADEITVQEFKDYFDRGQFVYGTTTDEVRDIDITRAIAEMSSTINIDLYPTDPICDLAQLYLTAHFLDRDVDASASGGQPSILQSSRSADGLSESVAIPEWMREGEFAFYGSTYWGQKFLILSKPYLDGAVFSVPGGTNV